MQLHDGDDGGRMIFKFIRHSKNRSMYCYTRKRRVNYEDVFELLKCGPIQVTEKGKDITETILKKLLVRFLIKDKNFDRSDLILKMLKASKVEGRIYPGT